MSTGTIAKVLVTVINFAPMSSRIVLIFVIVLIQLTTVLKNAKEYANYT